MSRAIGSITPRSRRAGSSEASIQSAVTLATQDPRRGADRGIELRARVPLAFRGN